MLHALNIGSGESSPVCIGGLFFDPVTTAAK